MEDKRRDQSGAADDQTGVSETDVIVSRFDHVTAVARFIGKFRGRILVSEPHRCPLAPFDLANDALCVGHCLDEAPNTAYHRVEVRKHLVIDYHR